jgi:hypothetical protein
VDCDSDIMEGPGIIVLENWEVYDF